MPRKCPTCGRPVPGPGNGSAGTPADRSAFPFCSERCRLADLGKWLDGAYRIGAPIAEEDLDEGLPTDGSADHDRGDKKVPQ